LGLETIEKEGSRKKVLVFVQIYIQWKELKTTTKTWSKLQQQDTTVEVLAIRKRDEEREEDILATYSREENEISKKFIR